MNSASSLSGRVRSIVAALSVLALGTGFVFLSGPPPPDTTVVLLTNGIPAQKGSLFDRTVPMTWSWVWRFKDFVLGPRKTITLLATLIDCASWPPSVASTLSPRALQYTDTNGLQIWLLDDGELIKELYS